MSKKHDRIIWRDSDYVEAVKVLRKSHMFDLSAKAGFNLRKKLTKHQKAKIRQFDRLVKYTTGNPHRSFALVVPRTFNQRKALKNLTGITSNLVKAFPVPVLPKLKHKFSFDNKGRLVIGYLQIGTRQIVAPLKLTEVLKYVDYSAEETEIKDAAAHEYFKKVYEVMGDLDGAPNVSFRLTTSGGDINPSIYSPTQFLEHVEEYLTTFFNNYLNKVIKTDRKGNEVEDIEMPLHLNGVSAWQTDHDFTTKDYKVLTHDFTLPREGKRYSPTQTQTKQAGQGKPKAKPKAKAKKRSKKNVRSNDR